MRAFLPVLLIAALAFPASAGHCTTWSTANPEVDLAGHLYVDRDGGDADSLGALWIYQESNGIPGLQREDEVRDTTCHGMIDGDTVIF